MKYKVCIYSDDISIIKEYFKTKNEAIIYLRCCRVYLSAVEGYGLKFSIKIYKNGKEIKND